MAEVLTGSAGWDDCPHGLPTLTCSACRNPYKPPPKPTVEAEFTARYDGHCDSCNLPILVGQRIVRMSDDRYLHKECAT